jgi:putative RNA 2'-phosphotransferase
VAAKHTSLSKFLSLVLRHRPSVVGLSLDAQGWADVDELLARCHAHGRSFDRATLDEMVATNPKQRFAFSDDKRRIRASQGHSVDVELGYEAAIPPARLFHGTVAGVLAAIRAEGLRKMRRHHVHLSADEATARLVGARRGAPVILTVDAAAMHTAKHVFYVSANGVWLTEAVPPEFLVFPT